MTTSQPLPGPAEPARWPAWAALLAWPIGDRPRARIHMVGIGGAGLSAIARVLLQRGYCVSGSDSRASAATAELAELGATVMIGHHQENVLEGFAATSSGAAAMQGSDMGSTTARHPALVLISSAVPGDNPEVLAARAAGIPVVKREQFLGPLMAGHVNICVAGTHGKTTTSALLATLLDSAGAEPSFIVGSQILALGANARAGRPGGPFVLEADEYDHAFLGLRPLVAVVANIEWDHVDCYATPEDYFRAFQEFVSLTAAGGAVVYCADDPGARRLREITAPRQAGDPRWVSYGLTEGCDWRASAIQPNSLGGSDFILERAGQPTGPLSLGLAGQHNMLNTLGALAAAAEAGYVFTEPCKNLKFLRNWPGTARRLEQKGDSCDIIVFDDYAHHPTEVRATLSAVRQRFPRRAVWALFQPHTYSRTQALLNDFCNSFENADHVLITDIYAARERATLGVSAQDLAAALSSHPDARYAGDLESAARLLLAELRPGAVLLTLGAGDGYQVGEAVLAELKRREGPDAALPGAPMPPQGQAPSHSLESRLAELAADIQQRVGLSALRNEPLAGHTTLRVGGPADLFVVVATLDDLLAVVGLARRRGVPFWLLGGGSNVLVSDRGVRGLVIANGCRAVRRHEGQVVWAESGANLAGLARQAIRWGLAGLEWGVSVPGTVGGAVVGNAGAHGGRLADNLLRVTLLQADGSLAEWPAARLHYSYRSSVLKEQLRAGQASPIVLSAAFQLAAAESEMLEQRAAGFLAHRRATQPNEPSAGSIFQNPPGDYAGRILDALGLKGRRQGGAAISTVHANFIVNLGGASAADVLSLIDQARQAAWQAMGVELTPEILFIGDWLQQPPAKLPVANRS